MTCMAVVFATLGACTNNHLEPSTTDGAPLSLSVLTSTIPSKSIISGNILAEGSEIGVTLTENDGTIYNGLPYSNVRFSAGNSGGKQVWSPEMDVMLSSDIATLYAYYPYSTDVRDISSIPVKASSGIQTDYMYADPVKDLSNRNAKATVVLKHALSAVRVSVSRGTFTGPGKITSLSVSGGNIATEAVLDARNGMLSSIDGVGTEITVQAEILVPAKEAASIDVIVIPTGKKSEIEIKATIDGKEYTVHTEAVLLEQGKIAVFDATLNNSDMTLSSIQIDDWSYDSSGNPVIEHKWKVTLGGDISGISFANSIEDDNTVKIIAVPISESAEVNPVTISGTASYADEVEPTRGTRTIYISDIQSDITVNFTGVGRWITATYDIVDISAATKIYNSGTCIRMKIDGTEVTPAKEYLFDSLGEHTVKLMFKTNSSIDGSTFRLIPRVTSISIPEGITELGSYGINHCSSLLSIDLPESLTSAGYDAFSYNGKLKSIILPDNLKFGGLAFRQCSNLEEVKLPANLTRIPYHTFSGCVSLKHVDIPAGVTTVEYNAFEQSGILSLDLPDGITSIADNLCASCSSLKSVTIPKGITSIGMNAFSFCTSLEEINFKGQECEAKKLIIPEGYTKIGSLAFNRCDKMEALHIPSSLTEIGYGAFSISSITDVSVAEDHPTLEVIDDFCGIVEKGTGDIYLGFTGGNIIPPTARRIKGYAYYGIRITNVTLHENITYLEDYAFYNTPELRVITCKATTPPEVGGNHVFQYVTLNGTLRVPSGSVAAYRESPWMSTAEGGLGYLQWAITEIK